MKKRNVLALVLVLALCLGMTACGTTERYPEIADMLDAGDYQGAVSAIYDMYMATYVEPTTDPTETTEPVPTVDPEVEQMYNRLTNAVTNLENRIENGYSMSGFNVWYSTDTESVDMYGADALQWVYETALALADQYPDAADIAARFTVLENVLLKQNIWYEDALGNVNNYSSYTHEYDAAGTDLTTSTSDYITPPDNYSYNYGTPEYTYDASGLLTTLRYISGDDKVNCVIDYTYNADGTVATEHYLDRYGKEYTTVYTYDENGVLILAEGAPYGAGGSGTMTVTYTYDDQGRLTRAVGVEENNDSSWRYDKVTDYVYDDAGNMISLRTYQECYWRGDLDRYSSVRVWNYSCGDDGQVLQNTYTSYGDYNADGTRTSTDTPTTYITDYTYGTWYAYTPAE